MPRYEYFCNNCGKEFETEATIAEKEKGLKVTCPGCGSTNTAQIFTNFFTFSKSKKNNSGGGVSGSGCCPGGSCGL